MSNIIFCKFLNCLSEKQDFQSYPGKLGKRIYKEISKIAWKKWIIKQTILINEKKLNTNKKEDYLFLEEEMIKFLFKNKNNK